LTNRPWCVRPATKVLCMNLPPLKSSPHCIVFMNLAMFHHGIQDLTTWYNSLTQPREKLSRSGTSTVLTDPHLLIFVPPKRVQTWSWHPWKYRRASGRSVNNQNHTYF
jgi:hypothetical protein